MELSGRRALVTGASRNLGSEIARALARLGATVVVNYLSSAEEADRLVEELRAEFAGGHTAIRGDVTDPGEVVAMVERVVSRIGPVDILVNNTGPFSKTPFAAMPEAEWDRVWDANVKAAYLCVRAVAPPMREAGWGRVVNLSAVSAYVRNRSIYGLAKAATEVLTEELALELGPEITVNAVAPGQIRESLDEMAGYDPRWASSVTERTPLGRLVTRAEVAELVTLLCTSRFDMVTGVTIPIDGGLRLNRF